MYCRLAACPSLSNLSSLGIGATAATAVAARNSRLSTSTSLRICQECRANPTEYAKEWLGGDSGRSRPSRATTARSRRMSLDGAEWPPVAAPRPDHERQEPQRQHSDAEQDHLDLRRREDEDP